jgi:hypothetical protein
VPIGAPWCTLCFADLRPKPVVPAEPAPVPAAATVLDATPAPALEPVSVGGGASPLSSPLPPDPILDAPVIKAPSLGGNRAAAAWPCTGCGDMVPMAEMTCPSCATPFLAAVRSRPSLVLPGIGEVTELDNTGKIKLIAGGAVGLCLVLFLVYLVLGHLV